MNLRNKEKRYKKNLNKMFFDPQLKDFEKPYKNMKECFYEEQPNHFYNCWGCGSIETNANSFDVNDRTETYMICFSCGYFIDTANRR